MQVSFSCPLNEVAVYAKRAAASQRSLSSYIAHVLREVHYRTINKGVIAERVRPTTLLTLRSAYRPARAK